MYPQIACELVLEPLLGNEFVWKPLPEPDLVWEALLELDFVLGKCGPLAGGFKSGTSPGRMSV